MALGFFKKLLTTDRTPSSLSPSEPAILSSSIQASISPDSAQAGDALITLRDELINDTARIVGYRISVKSLNEKHSATPLQKLAALQRDRLGDLTMRRKAIIPLTDKDWFAADFAQFANSNTNFYLPTPNVHEQRDWQQTISLIKEAGASIAIDSAGLAATPCPPDLLLLNFQAQALQAFEQLVADAQDKYPDTPILVEGVQSWNEHRLCQALGVRWSMGEFSTREDDSISGTKLDQSRLIIVEMLNLLRRDGTASELAAIAKRDPAITIKLLEMANSPLSGLSAQVASIDKAMMVLGREALYRWLLLSMFRSGKANSRNETLLELALFRGRFLEQLAHHQLARAECDELFLVGLLSLTDSLLNLPMTEVVNRMHLPTQVKEVLLNSDGPYGRWLMLAMAVEKGRERQIIDLAKSLQLSTEQLDSAIHEARLWAETAMNSSSA